MDLKQLMHEHNLTKAELARLMGCSVDTLHSYLYRSGTVIPQHRLDLLKFNLEKEKS